MNLKTGDRVRFLNEVGEGKVKNFQNNNIVNIEMDDGFEIPMKINELIKIENRREDSEAIEGMKETVSLEKSIDIDLPDEITLKDDNGIFLLIVKKGIDSYNLAVVNDTDYFIQFLLCKKENDHSHYLNNGIIEDNTKIIINTLNQEEIKKTGTVTFQCILFGKKTFELKDPINILVDLGKLSFMNMAFIENDYFDDKAIVIKLENDDLSKEIKKLTNADINAIISLKEDKQKKVGDFLKANKKKNNFEEVDLHIESIVEDHSKMSPGEIINAQLSRFEIALTGAIKNNQRRIVFIHGIGNGKLKYEMGKILDKKYPDLKYQDASFKEYGYGAMMVIIK